MCREHWQINQYFPLRTVLLACISLVNLNSLTSSAIVTDSKCLQISEIKGDLRTRIPWTAAIYLKSSPNSSFHFLVTGTIIGPNTVLTLFGTSSNNGSRSHKKEIYAADRLLIGSGLLSTNLKSADEFAQLRQVKYLQPYTQNKSEGLSYRYFMVFVDKPFDFSSQYVRPICLGNPFASKDISPFGWNLIIGGFSLPRGQDRGLRLSTQLLYPEYEKVCAREFKFHYKTEFINMDLICGQRDAKRDKNDLQCILHGSPGFIYVENIGTLAGITALIPERKLGNCADNSLYFLSTIASPLEWIKINL